VGKRKEIHFVISVVHGDASVRCHGPPLKAGLGRILGQRYAVV